MASTYTRKESPFVHLRFKEGGKWKSRATEWRKDNLGDVRQAKLFAKKLKREEQARQPVRSGGLWREWVERWLVTKYGTRENDTLNVYRRHWEKVERWLASEGLTSPAQLSYKHALLYRDARIADGASNNLTIQELKVLSMVMQEAVRREFAPGNPFVKMGIERDKPKEKNPWQDHEIAAVSAAIPNGNHFLRATFLLGLYQAARLRQCVVPLADISVETMRITYRRAKGDKPFTQPLDPRCVAPLSQLIADRRAIGATKLCDLPILPSVEWRQFLDSIDPTGGPEGIPKYAHLVHHGLRVTWITRAALSRGAVSQPEARRFVNHGSASIHALYQKLNADDVAHVPSAMNLPTLAALALPAPQPIPDSEPGSSSGAADT